MKKGNVLLNTPTRIVRFLGDITNDLKNNKIDTDKAKALGYLCNIMIKALEVSDLEKRLEELEQANNVEGG